MSCVLANDGQRRHEQNEEYQQATEDPAPPWRGIAEPITHQVAGFGGRLGYFFQIIFVLLRSGCRARLPGLLGGSALLQTVERNTKIQIEVRVGDNPLF